MIQRIQTVWLLLASVTILVLFLFPYAQFSDNSGIAMALKVTGVLNNTGGRNQLSTSFTFILQAIATILLAVLPLITILKYKNRKKQVSLILVTLLLVILFAFWLFLSANSAVEAVNKSLELNNIGIGALLIPPYIIFLLLALKGINHDTKLIKSADRLR
ncbi:MULTISPECIES: DUF4293 domain-containing protein [Olivibacter]|jgi:hypothetical protein|uniref:DUF4293 domain-containing protein n=2 Tax=Sphingobacteriaceae TaxID=84566 RepID=F4CDT9_SPHS2|nr:MULTISPECIES: DUF4293 domain-containing protein [Olivibacter]MDM8176195.1 DUF4293 domain-containing protein [Olivibacter sp. 47]QEL00955.1 DUF4293 family protein [Olivibacter sp. LS-1]